MELKIGTPLLSTHNLQQKIGNVRNVNPKGFTFPKNESLQYQMFVHNKIFNKVSPDVYEVNLQAQIKNIQGYAPCSGSTG